MKIPKVIHYCWFGRGDKPELVVKCIESWKKVLPEYEIVEWNEDNFDIESNLYTKQAYEKKKYAFVSDYARLYILYNYGGIYMDTDVEVLKTLDPFLKHTAFSGFENNNTVTSGVMAASKHNKWIKDLLDEYKDLHFIKEDGSLDLTPNVDRITKLSINKYGLKLNSSYQEIKNIVVFYPSDYFCPKDWETGDINITENTVVIHHFSASWHTKKQQKLNDIRRRYIKKYGVDKGTKKYKKHLHRWDFLKYLLLPFRCILHPIKATKKVLKVLGVSKD